MQQSNWLTSNPMQRTRLLSRLVVAGLIFGAWELYGQLGNALLLPPVSAVVTAFADLVTGRDFWEALLSSLRLLVLGFGIAIAVGVVLGFLIGRSRVADLTFSPYLSAMYATPSIALVPLFLVWFGFGITGKVVVVFTAAVFPILYNVTAGVKNAPSDLIDVARSFGCSRVGMLLQVILPAAIPFIMAGIRLSIGRAVVGMSVAEVYLRIGGIGGLISTYGSRFIIDYLIAAIIVLPAMGIGLTKLLGVIERRLAPWRAV